MKPKKILAVIPAKIGSTRLKQKNIKELNGKPLIYYPIKMAQESQLFDEIMVSTDSEEIAGIAKQAGASIPFMRPELLGRDPYGVADVCLHVLEEYEAKGVFFKKLVILLPTSPLCMVTDLVKANKIFDKKDASFLMSVSEFDHNPFAALMKSEVSDNIMESCFVNEVAKKRHEVPKTYRANGAICIVDVKSFQEIKTYYGTPLYTYVMPMDRSVDIDTEMDLKFAEFLISRGIKNE
ncbi:MAG: acylneuraminate cytidylyltransferase family protein [Bacteroidetes bacterium]|nr:acylneuraminate cytidylyltransferase family protein [Bacteroidota bacterium]